MDRLTPDELAAIQARVVAATEGPWMAAYHYADETVGAPLEEIQVRTYTHYEIGRPVFPGNGIHPTEVDAEFVAHARQDIPRLLADRAVLEARVADVEGALRYLAIESIYISTELGLWLEQNHHFDVRTAGEIAKDIVAEGQRKWQVVSAPYRPEALTSILGREVADE